MSMFKAARQKHTISKSRRKKNGVPDWLQLDKKVETSFEYVVGHDYIKKKLIDMTKTLPNRVLLSGSEGVGKSLLAEALANYLSVPLLTLTVDSNRTPSQQLLSKIQKYSRQREIQEYESDEYINPQEVDDLHRAKLAEAFKYAKLQAPCVLVIDEIEWFTATNSLVQLCKQLDSLVKDEHRVFVVACTRHDLCDFDPMVTSHLCFDKQLILNQATRDQQIAIFCRELAKPEFAALKQSGDNKETLANGQVQIAWLVASLGADANGKKIRRYLESLVQRLQGTDKVLTRDDIVQEMEWQRALVRELRYSAEDLKRVAIYRAGQAVVCVLMKGPTSLLRISLLNSYNEVHSHMDRKEAPKESVRTLSMINSNITILYGGCVAEEMLAGENSTLCKADMNQIAQYLKEMYCSDMMGFLSLPRSRSVKGITAFVEDQFNDYCIKLKSNARQLLENNRSLLSAMVDALLTKTTLYTWDVEELYQRELQQQQQQQLQQPQLQQQQSEEKSPTVYSVPLSSSLTLSSSPLPSFVSLPTLSIPELSIQESSIPEASILESSESSESAEPVPVDDGVM